MMSPEVAARAIRTCVEETNRLNRERRATDTADRAELDKVLKAIKGVLDIVEEGKEHAPSSTASSIWKHRRTPSAPVSLPPRLMFRISIPTSPRSIAARSSG
ncbi:hypothetical protein ACFSHP_26795 [Novosphingobium panipatense]